MTYVVGALLIVVAIQAGSLVALLIRGKRQARAEVRVVFLTMHRDAACVPSSPASPSARLVRKS
jgi:hypothetical protein